MVDYSVLPAQTNWLACCIMPPANLTLVLVWHHAKTFSVPLSVRVLRFMKLKRTWFSTNPAVRSRIMFFIYQTADWKIFLSYTLGFHVKTLIKIQVLVMTEIGAKCTENYLPCFFG